MQYPWINNNQLICLKRDCKNRSECIVPHISHTTLLLNSTSGVHART